MCTDHPVVQTLVGRILDRRIITYGANPQADVRLVDIDHARRRVALHRCSSAIAPATATHEIAKLTLPMPGRHNALNATSAIAVAHELGVPDERIRKALAGFGGVRRRFTRTGEWNGVTIIDDYGHHPVEIAAVLRAAREIEQGQGHRRGAAASLLAARGAVRRVLHLLQRRRRGDRRRCLSRPAKRRSPGADRDHSCRACARAVIAR